MQSFIVPITMIAVTVLGGGFLLLFLKIDKRRSIPVSREQAALQTAQEFINVKDINDKILYTRDQQAFIYLRIHSISVDLYSASEKNTLIRTLSAELSDIQHPFKFIAVSRPVDISPLIHEMTDMLSEAEDRQKELLRQEILQMSGYALSGDIVERQFYIVLWEPYEDGCETELQKRAALLCEKFSSGGITSDVLNEKEIVRLLNLVNNPNYTHLEDAEYTASIPLLKGE